MNRFLLVALIIIAFACKEKKPDPVAENLIPFTLVKTFPHDQTAFTQGLTIEYGRLFESTGKENSWISEVAITTGVQSKKVVLDPKYFGEGISILNNKVYQLTWQN